ncbi:hypothetical protein D9615_001493 [Tricholomella constricta]|uniref:Uncharacterized protein n=1 Tax=Tricholomella constricta TaxID=117010 RepID=A0A8H5M8Y8_9AGAR|nr:hypothetical protein D9615_001493 [Tricholomella constricta]
MGGLSERPTSIWWFSNKGSSRQVFHRTADANPLDLLVFQFHFTDISQHTDRVRSRIIQLEEVFNMSSDWIAHGILDSIVDSFFPLLEDIGKEVAAIEDLVLTAAPFPGAPQHHMPPVPVQRSRESDEMESTSIDSLQVEKQSTTSADHVKPRFSSPRLTLPLALRRLRRFIANQWRTLRKVKDVPQPSPTYTTLRRMARSRRLVTSLTRLLATKLEVIAQIRKRLLTSSKAVPANRKRWNDDLDVAIYMGDVQDHILTLQHSLAHYERILSHSHPTYLSQLRTGVALTKSGTDKAIIYLTFVSMAVLCIQTLIGVFSTNVTMPTNDHSPEGSYNIFGIIIAVSICILCTYAYVVRRWWNQAKEKRR